MSADAAVLSTIAHHTAYSVFYRPHKGALGLFFEFIELYLSVTFPTMHGGHYSSAFIIDKLYLAINTVIFNVLLISHHFRIAPHLPTRIQLNMKTPFDLFVTNLMSLR